MNNLFFANNENNDRHLEQKCPPPPPTKPPKPPSPKPGSKKKKVDFNKFLSEWKYLQYIFHLAELQCYQMAFELLISMYQE